MDDTPLEKESREVGARITDATFERSLPWLRKRHPVPWALFQLFKVVISYLKVLPRLVLTRGQEKKFAILEQAFVNLLRSWALMMKTLDEEPRPDASPEKRAQSLLASAWRLSFCLTTMTAEDGALVGDVFDQKDLQSAIDKVEHTLQSYESAVALVERPRGFSDRLRKASRAGRYAMIHANLANAYLYVPESAPGPILETMRAHYEAALASLQEEKLPELSGWISANLGSLLLSYPTEHQRAYAERALRALMHARDAYVPYVPLAQAVKNLGDKPRLRSVAKFFWLAGPRLWSGVWRGSRSTVIADWANPGVGVKLEWGLAIAHRRVGELEAAVRHFDAALEWTSEHDLEGRAAIQVSKGLAYLEAENGDRVLNVTRARQSLDKALDECIVAIGASLPERCFSEPAPLQVRKGWEYINSSEGDPIRNFMLGLKCFEKVFGKIRITEPPVYGMALVHHARACLEPEARAAAKAQDREEDLAGLTDGLRTALRVARRQHMHALAQEALLLLGDVHALRNEPRRAYQALALAARVGERARAIARTPRLKQYFTGTRGTLYGRLLSMALERAHVRDASARAERETDPRALMSRVALSFAERGRTRFLHEQLASRELLPPGAARGELAEFFALRRQWVAADLSLLEQEATLNDLRDPRVTAILRRRRNALEGRYFDELKRIRETFEDPKYDPDEPISPIRFAAITSMVEVLSETTPTALVEYYITDETLVAFVILPGAAGIQQACCFVDTGVSREELEKLAARWSQGYTALRSPVAPLHARQWERGYLLQILDRLRRVIETPAREIECWEKRTRRRVGRVIIVPHRFLHLVPLHAVRLPGGKLWGESVSIHYAPSASVLWRLRAADFPGGAVSGQSPCLRNGGKVLAVTYTPPHARSPAREQTLLFNAYEARAVAAATGGEVLEGPQASPHRVVGAMENATYIHFACHGTFNSEAPLEGGLELAPEDGANKKRRESQRLTLGEVFERVHLSQARLVILSACDTGIPKVEEFRDEYIGLPAGFLYAGARTVVSTLWPVSDVATWLLMQTMAQELAVSVEPPVALTRAQHTLRRLSAEQVAQQIFRAASTEEDCARREQMVEEGQHMREFGKSEPYPFASPYWWAGFTVNGLG